MLEILARVTAVCLLLLAGMFLIPGLCEFDLSKVLVAPYAHLSRS